MADLAQTVQRWQESASAGQQRYVDGVQATTKDVVGLAIAAQPKLLAGFQQAVTSGRWARRLSERGTAGWKAATVAKASNYSTGIQAGVQDYQRAMQVWLPIIQSAAQSVQAMPNVTFQDSLNRMTAFSTALHNAKQSS
jgi:hypothetical protein